VLCNIVDLTYLVLDILYLPLQPELPLDIHPLLLSPNSSLELSFLGCQPLSLG